MCWYHYKSVQFCQHSLTDINNKKIGVYKEEDLSRPLDSSYAIKDKNSILSLEQAL